MSARGIISEVPFTPTFYVRTHWVAFIYLGLKRLLILFTIFWIYRDAVFTKKILLKWAESSTVTLITQYKISKSTYSWPKLKPKLLTGLKKLKQKFINAEAEEKLITNKKSRLKWNGLRVKALQRFQSSGPLPSQLTFTSRARGYLSFLFDINYIKKERLYTKLKYSRSPAYDIVSGGSAALFAGFIGFLISEKFGIELVDSGDFYIVFMYAVFLAFACRPFLKIISKTGKVWNVFTINYFLDYLNCIFIFLIRVLKRSFLVTYNWGGVVYINTLSIPLLFQSTFLTF